MQVSRDLFGDLFDTIAMDPPWAENGGGKSKRGADKHYPTHPTKDLPGIIMGSGVWRPNPAGCNVWMWTTANFLKDAMWLLDQLGVHYVTNVVWVKCRGEDDGIELEDLTDDAVRIGLGQHFRLAHEHLLYGRIGRVPVPEPVNRMPTVKVAAPGRHSEKPAVFRELMGRHDGPGRRLEMFARAPIPGWDVWGNEVS